MWGLPSSGFRIWVHSDIVHLWSLRILRWLRGPFAWIHAISKKHTVSKHLSLSIGWLGFRPDTHRENYAEKQIFPWKWFCKLIPSVSFVLLWGHFDTHTHTHTQRERERERERVLPPSIISWIFQLHKCSCYLWQQHSGQAHSCGKRMQLHTNCSEPMCNGPCSDSLNDSSAGTGLPQPRLDRQGKSCANAENCDSMWRKGKEASLNPLSMTGICQAKSLMVTLRSNLLHSTPGMQMLSLLVSCFPKRRSHSNGLCQVVSTFLWWNSWHWKKKKERESKAKQHGGACVQAQVL